MPDPRFEPATPLSETQIEELETVLGRQLPQEYRDFLTQYGGAFVGGSIDGTEELPILSFFGAEEDKGLLATLKAYPDLRADGVLPIARCALGNIYVLDRNNAIHYINYYGGKTTAQKVAASFHNFIARIVVPEE